METFNHGVEVAQSRVGSMKLELWGRVTSYDPEKHAIKALIPQYRDEESDDEFETDWIPLGSLASGEKSGWQFAPGGGATKDNDKGEHVKITVFHRGSGHWVGAQLYYDDTQTPPGAGQSEEDEQQQQQELDDQPEGDEKDPRGLKKLEAKELIFRHDSGSFLKFYENGDVQVYAKGDLLVYAQQNLTAVVREKDLNVTVDKGDANIEVTKGDLNVTVDEGDTTLDVKMGDITIEAELGDIDIKADKGSVSVEAPEGDIYVLSEAGSITVNTAEGDVIVQSDEGAVSVSGATAVTVTSDADITISAPTIQAALDPETAQNLCNTIFMETFNAHTHTCAAGQSTPPDPLAVQGIDTTVDFLAG